MTPAGHHWPLVWGISGIPKCVSTSGYSPGHISQLWVSQKEIRLLISYPYHPLCPPQSTGLQAMVRSQPALAAKPWVYHQIWIFSLISSSSEPRVLKLVQQSVRGYLYLHPKLQPRSPPSHTDKPWRWLVLILCLTQLKTLSSDMQAQKHPGLGRQAIISCLKGESSYCAVLCVFYRAEQLWSLPGFLSCLSVTNSLHGLCKEPKLLIKMFSIALCSPVHSIV